MVPWYPSDEHRQRAWDWLKRRYITRHPDWQVVEGYGGVPWRKAAAVADGLERASGDTLILHDADVWVDNLAEAVDTLHQGARWVIPHHLVHRLTPEATNQVLAGAEPTVKLGLAERPYPGWPGGGIVVVRRADYELAPIDPRFESWGQEDLSLSYTLDCLIGRHTRLNGDLWHLWHPPQQRMSRAVGSPHSEALGERYRQARRRPDLMAQLVDEGRQSWHASR